MLKALRCIALLSLAAAPLALRADTYNFSISTAAANKDPAVSFMATGSLSGPVDPFNPNALDLTSMTGQANGYTISGVSNPGTSNSHTPITSNGFTFDNVLLVPNGSPHADSIGLLMLLTSPVGTSLAHVFYSGATTANPGGYEVDVVDPREPGVITPFAVTSFTLSAAPSSVPEPSTLALFGTGIAGLTTVVRRRRSR